MPTLEQNKIAIQNLISKSNSVTGKTDADLTSAVNSLIEGQGIVPEGTEHIQADGSYDVTNLQRIVVDVEHKGTAEITENGICNVSGYKNANVNVVPTKDILILENGEYDVAEYGTAVIQVPETKHELYGQWKFKAELPLPSEDIVQDINFTANTYNFNKMEITSVFAGNLVVSTGAVVYYYRKDDGEETEAYKPETSPHWANENYREVNYGTTPQSVSKAYYEYVTSNAEIVIGDGETVPEWDGSFTKTRDLTGTTWEFASGWHTEANQGVYEIEGELTVDSTVVISSLALGSPDGGVSGMSDRISVLTDGTWYSISNGVAFTLKITGGKDASNSDLVRWVESDGKLQ